MAINEITSDNYGYPIGMALAIAAKAWQVKENNYQSLQTMNYQWL